MSMDFSMDVMYEERQADFGTHFEGGEPQEMGDLIFATGEWLERLLWSQTAADTVMKTLHAGLVGSEIDTDPNVSWRDLWREGAEHWAGTIVQIMVELHAFGLWGLRPDLRVLDIRDDEDLAVAIERMISKMRSLLDAAPQGWADLREVRTTIAAAEARIRLDTGCNVTPEQLAALAEVGLKSMKNLLAPKGGSGDLKLDAHGEIARSAALTWLNDRPNFRSSLWRNADTSVDHDPIEEALGEVVFVPVAKDGSWFDPVSCRTQRGFTVGPKGAEIHVSDYREALGLLARMPTPYWRRPNPAGTWGLVAGVVWQRREMRELDQLVSPYAEGARS